LDRPLYKYKFIFPLIINYNNINNNFQQNESHKMKKPRLENNGKFPPF
jgi:hypothetical protein